MCFVGIEKQKEGYVWVGMRNRGRKRHEIRPKIGPNFVTAGAPGRGVLRFFAGGYRNPVHFLAIFRVFSKNLQT